VPVRRRLTAFLAEHGLPLRTYILNFYGMKKSNRYAIQSTSQTVTDEHKMGSE
jgi:hypothetical protein